MKKGIQNAIWRSRAVAIIGLAIIILVIFPGLPAPLKGTLFVIFGLISMSFGLAGSRHKSYDDDYLALLADQTKKTDSDIVPATHLPENDLSAVEMEEKTNDNQVG